MSKKNTKKLDPARLVGPNGEFVSSFPGNPDESILSIGYIEELCEWVYHHNNMTSAEKLFFITGLEAVISEKFSGEDENGKIKEDSDLPFGFPIKYIPTWSKKLIRNEKRKLKKDGN